MSRVIRIGLICAGVLIIAMILSAPNIMAPRETDVVKAITILHTAQVQYYSSYDHFASSTRELGPSGANLIESDLANGEKDGYRYTIHLTPSGYTLSAVPIRFGITGRKSYFSGSDTQIYIHNGPEPATPGDLMLGESPSTQ